MLLVLDLLGSPNPSVSSHYLTTHWAYVNLANLELRMRVQGLLESTPQKAFFPDGRRQRTWFSEQTVLGPAVEDDHLPFMERGVPVLPLIPAQKPAVWQTPEDDGNHLDLAVVRDWARIVTAFVFEWLDMMEVEPEQPGTQPTG